MTQTLMVLPFRPGSGSGTGTGFAGMTGIGIFLRYRRQVSNFEFRSLGFVCYLLFGICYFSCCILLKKETLVDAGTPWRNNFPFHIKRVNQQIGLPFIIQYPLLV
jgi:hypothetical protein